MSHNRLSVGVLQPGCAIGLTEIAGKDGEIRASFPDAAGGVGSTMSTASGWSSWVSGFFSPTCDHDRSRNWLWLFLALALFLTFLSAGALRPPQVSLVLGAGHVSPGHGLCAVQPERLGNLHLYSGLAPRGIRIDQHGDRPFAAAMRSDRRGKLVVPSLMPGSGVWAWASPCCSA